MFLRCPNLIAGSSPLARGTLAFPRTITGRARFIPACAGNTHTSISVQSMRAVHPRLRGEHIRSVVLVYRRYGSSPLARGTPSRLGSMLPYRRFIPACAGNTCKYNDKESTLTVHPRLRGEHTSKTARNTPFFTFLKQKHLVAQKTLYRFLHFLLSFWKKRNQFQPIVFNRNSPVCTERTKIIA